MQYNPLYTNPIILHKVQAIIDTKSLPSMQLLDFLILPIRLPPLCSTNIKAYAVIAQAHQLSLLVS